MNHKITIGIPTYNRENQLRNQLQCKIKQDLTFVEEIIIVDNHSNYDIVNSISELNCTKLRLITNPFNIKMATNMEMPFLYCKTEWLWLLSDDDEVLPDSINTITDVKMDFCQSCILENRINTPEAYERLLDDAFGHDDTLFTPWQIVEMSWKFGESVRELVKIENRPLVLYPANSQGPKEADEMLQRDGFEWLDEDEISY